MIWYGTMLILVFGNFWMNRRDYAAGVLLRLGFWRRAVQCIVIPLVLLGTTFSLLENTGNPPWLHGIWHLVMSLLSIFEMWRVLLGDSVSFAYDDPQRNPVVAHYILLGVPVLGVSTVAATVLFDVLVNPLQGGRIGWHALSNAVQQPPGEYIFMLGCMFTAAAAAATWRLVDMVCAYHEEECDRGVGRQECKRSLDEWMSQQASAGEETKHSMGSPAGRKAAPGGALPSRKAALVLGYIAVLSAFLGATCQTWALRVQFMTAFLTLEAIAVFLNTASALRVLQRSALKLSDKHDARKRAARLRVVITGLLLLATMGFLGTFVEPVFIPDSLHGSREFIYTCLGAVMLGLYFLWPLTWFKEARETLTCVVQRYRVCG